MYAVVVLTDSGEVLVAASNWLTADKKQCYWPPFKSTERCMEATEKRVDPEKDGKTWEKLNICFHRKYDTFERAKEGQKEVKEEFSGTPKRQRLDSSKNQLLTPASTSSSITLMSADDNDEILQMLRDIKSTVQENFEMLQKLRPDKAVAEAPSSTSKPSVKAHLKLPLETIDDVDRTETELCNAAAHKTFVKRLSGLGGFGPKDVIKYIMQQLLTDDLAKDFNWQGRGDKRPFSQLGNILEVIREAASKKKVTSSECETEIKKYLIQAADRVARKRLREQGGPGNDGQPPEKRPFMSVFE